MKIKDWSSKLIAATVLITVVRYMGAFAIADAGKISGAASEGLTFLLTLSGLGMGILDTVGGGLLFNGWRLAMPKNGNAWTFRFKVLTFCVFGLITSGLTILVPFTIARVAQESIVDSLGGKGSVFLWAWALMVNVIPYLLVAGVFVGNRMVEGMEEEKKVSKVSETYHWRRLTPAEKQSVKGMTKTQILVAYPGMSEKTAENWEKWSRKL